MPPGTRPAGSTVEQGPPKASARPGATRSRRSFGLGLLLLALPLLVLVPVLVYSSVLLYLMADQARDSAERELVATNQALVAAVERELDHVVKSMTLMARSPAFAAASISPERMPHLLETLVEAEASLRYAALQDPQGRMVQQHPVPPELPARPGLAPHQQRVLVTGQPVISDLYPSPQGAMVISVNVPVMREGEIAWVLSAQMDPEHLSRIMGQQVGSREAVATILDSQQRILARTADLEIFFGRRPSDETLTAVNARPRAVQRLRTLDGNEYVWAWTVTEIGWTLLLGTPTRAIDEALRASMLRLALAGLAVLLVGLLATVLLARRITRSVDRMAATTPGLVDGRPPPYRRSGIRQLDALYRALVHASAQVQRAFADRDRALAAERAARALADQDNRAKDVFIATLSHELRNPLAPIRAATQVLQSKRADPARRDWAVSVIDRQANAMGRLLDDLLDVARVSSGRIPLERRRVDLRTVLESAVETARPLIDSREHDFSMDLPQTPVLLDADPLRLAQVFANLLTNAAKYTDPGGRIAVRAERVGNQVLVRIKDNGIGLAPQALEQIFQTFAQVRGPLDRSQGGLGIGLSLVRDLVKLHGGWVRAQSEGLGLGSEFVVGLPVRGEAPPTAP